MALVIAIVALESGMLLYAWYGFYADSKYRYKARWAAALIKVTVCIILLALFKWWLVDLSLSATF